MYKMGTWGRSRPWPGRMGQGKVEAMTLGWGIQSLGPCSPSEQRCSATGREAWQDFVSFSFLSRRWASEKVTISLALLRPLASLTSVPPPRTGPGPVHHVIKTAVFAAGQMWVKRRLFPTQLRQTAVCCKKTKPVADGSRKRCLMRSLGCTQCSTQRLGTPAGPGRGQDAAQRQDAAQQNQSHDQAGELPLEGAVAAPAESGYELLSRPR